MHPQLCWTKIVIIIGMHLPQFFFSAMLQKRNPISFVDGVLGMITCLSVYTNVLYGSLAMQCVNRWTLVLVIGWFEGSLFKKKKQSLFPKVKNILQTKLIEHLFQQCQVEMTVSENSFISTFSPLNQHFFRLNMILKCWKSFLSMN